MPARTAGRKGRPWRRTRAAILAASDICWICGHPGSTEVDHIRALAYGGDPRDPTNLAPAHGSWGKCSTCGVACNQVRGTGRPRPRLRTVSPGHPRGRTRAGVTQGGRQAQQPNTVCHCYALVCTC